MSHVDADFAGLASPFQPLASPTAVPPGAAVPEDKREQFNDLLTQLQDNQAAKTMARTLTDSTSTGSSLQLAFLDAQAAYQALQSTWSSQADTPGLRAAYARMETCRAAIRQWVQDYIPSRLQTAFFEFLELTASPLVDHVAGVAESITAQRAPSLTRSQLVNLGPSIARMNQEALGALTREQVGWLTDLQLEALGPKVAELSSESLDSLLITRPESVPPAAIKALFSSPPVRLTDSQLTHLTSRLVSSLTRPDFNRLGGKVEFLNPLLLRALAPEQVSGVSLSALTIEKLGLFSASQLAQVDYAQLTGLAQDKLQALGGDIAGLPLGTVTRLPLQDLSGDQLEALTSEHLHALTPSQVNQLPLGRLSIGQLGSLQDAQLAQATPSTVANLTAAQVQALGVKIAGLPADALAALRPDQVSLMTPEQVVALDAKFANLQVSAIHQILNLNATPPMILSVTTAGIAALVRDTPSRATLTDRLAALTEDQVRNLTVAQVMSLGPLAGRLNAVWLSPLLERLVQKDLQSLTLDHFSVDQLGRLSVEQTTRLSESQVKALESIKLIQLVGQGKFSSIPARMFAYIDLTRIDSSQFAAITVNQLALATPYTVANLTAAQVQALGVKIAGLPAGALAALRPDQVSLMTREQVVALDAKFANLQVSAIHQILNLNATPPMILSVTTAGITALVRDHIETLTADRLVTLAETQVRSLTVAQVMSLGPLASRLNAVWLSPLLEGLGPTDLQSLTLDHFSVDQLGRLSVEQTTRLSESQVKALDSIKLIQLVGQGKFSSIPARMFAYIDLTRIDSSQLAAITVNQLAQATPYTVANLTAAQVRALGVKIAGLPAGALAALRPDQVRLMTPEQANALGAKIADLEGSVIDAIPDATLQSLITTLFGGTPQPTLTLQQINSLGKGIAFLPDPYLSGLLRDPASFQVISTEGITALFRRSRPGDEPDPLARYVRGSNPNTPPKLVAETHAGKLTPQQVTALLPEDLARLSSGSVAALTTTVLRSLTGAQVSGLRFSSLTSAQLSVLRPDQLAQVPVAEVRGLSREQMIALGPRLAGFSDEALGVLTEAQLNGIPAQQMAALGSKALRLSRSVRRDLLVRFPVFKERNPELFLDDQTLDLFTDQAVQKWSREQTRLCTAAQLLLLGDKLRQIKPAAIVGLKPQALRGVPLTQWAESQLRWMSPQQLEGVTAAEVSSLSDPQLLALGRSIVGLSPSAMSGVRLATLSPVQLRALRAPNMTQLTIEQVNSLSPDQFRLLLGVRGLSDDVLRGLSPLLVNAMTRSQVDALGARKALLPQAA